MLSRKSLNILSRTNSFSTLWRQSKEKITTVDLNKHKHQAIAEGAMYTNVEEGQLPVAIHGLVLLERDRLLATDVDNSMVLMFELTSGKLLHVLKMSRGCAYPWGVAVIDANTAVVTCPQNGKLVIVKISEYSLKLQNVIDIGEGCRGIVSFKGKLIVSFGHPSSGVKVLKVVDDRVELVQTFDNPTIEDDSLLLQEPWYLTLNIHTRRVLVADSFKPVVAIYNLEGNVEDIVTLTGTDVIQSTRGLANGPEGYFFLCCNLKIPLLMVSIDEKKVYTLLNEPEKTSCPGSVIFDEQNQKIYIGKYKTDEKSAAIRTFKLVSPGSESNTLA